MKKNLHSMIHSCIVLCVFLLCASSVRAYDFTLADANGNDINYTIIRDSISIFSNGAAISEEHVFKFTGDNVFVDASMTKPYSGNIIIPETVSYTIPGDVTPTTFQVVGLMDYAFAYGAEIKSVSLPNTLQVIGTFAFQACDSLSTIDIPDNVQYIGHDAFVRCALLESIHLPRNLETIENGLFNRCYALQNIVLPSSVRIINGHAFYACTGLTSFVLPDSVRRVDYSAFEGCSGLRWVSLAQVDSVGKMAFSGCSNLTSVSLLSQVPPALGTSAFVSSRDTLYVPADAVTAYQASDWNGYFKNIVGMNEAETKIETLSGNSVTLKWKPDEDVTLYDINVYAGSNHVARYLVDGDGKLTSSQRFAPTVYFHKKDTTVSTNEYFVITLDNLSEDTKYTYTIKGQNAQQEEVYHEEGVFRTAVRAQALTDAVANDPRPAARKILLNGQVFILRGEKIYTLQGKEMK